MDINLNSFSNLINNANPNDLDKKFMVVDKNGELKLSDVQESKEGEKTWGDWTLVDMNSTNEPTASAQSNSEVREALYRAIVSASTGVKIEKSGNQEEGIGVAKGMVDAADNGTGVLSSFINSLSVKLFGKAGEANNISEKPLTLREVKHLIAEARDLYVATTVSAFNKDNRALATNVSGMLARLNQIARDGDKLLLDPKLATEAKDMAADFVTKLGDLYKQVELGGGIGIGINELKKLYTEFLAKALPLSAKIDEAEFQKNTEEQITKFCDRWNKEVPNGRQGYMAVMRDAVVAKMRSCAQKLIGEFATEADEIITQAKNSNFTDADKKEVINVLTQVATKFSVKLDYIKTIADENIKYAKPWEKTINGAKATLDLALQKLGGCLNGVIEEIPAKGKANEIAALRTFVDQTIASYVESVKATLISCGVVTHESLEETAAKINDLVKTLESTINANTIKKLQIGQLNEKLTSIKLPQIEFELVDKCRPGEVSAAYAHVSPTIVKGKVDSNPKTERVRQQFENFSAAINKLIDNAKTLLGGTDDGIHLAAYLRLEHEKVRRELAPLVAVGVEIPGGLAKYLSTALKNIQSRVIQRCRQFAFVAMAQLKEECEIKLGQGAKSKTQKAQAGKTVILDHLNRLTDQLIKHLEQADVCVSYAQINRVRKEIIDTVDTFNADLGKLLTRKVPVLGKSDFSVAEKVSLGADPFEGEGKGYEGEFKDLLQKHIQQANIADSYQRLYGGVVNEYLDEYLDNTIAPKVEDAILNHSQAKSLSKYEDEKYVGLNDSGLEIKDQVKANVRKLLNDLLRESVHGDEVTARTKVEIARIIENALKGMEGGIENKIATEVDNAVVSKGLNVVDAPEDLNDRPVDVVKRGSGVFGIDIASLSFEEKQMLFNLATGLAIDTTRQIFTQAKNQYEQSAKTEQDQKEYESTLIKHLTDPDYKMPFNVSLLKVIGDSICSGAMKLSDLTPAFCELYRYHVDNEQNYRLHLTIYKKEMSAVKKPLGFQSPEKLLQVIQSNGIKLEDLKFDGKDNKKNCNRVLMNTMQYCRAMNYGDNYGLNDVCRRIFGCGLLEVTSQQIEDANRLASEYEREVEKLNRRVTNAKRKLANGESLSDEEEEDIESSYSSDWRDYIDPIKCISTDEKNVYLFLMRQRSPSSDKVEIADTAKLLTEFRKLKPESTYTGKFHGVPFTMKVDKRGALSVDMTVNLMKETKSGKLHYAGYKDKSANAPEMKLTEIKMPMSIPVKLDTFISQLEDEVASNVKAFGQDKALALLPNGAASDSRTRQLCINMLVSYLGMRTADFAQAATADLLKVTRLVMNAKLKTQSVENSMRQFVGSLNVKTLKENVTNFFKKNAQGITLLNSKGTLELYDKFVKAGDVKDKVFVPDPPKVYKGETPLQSRDRQIHEFVADLVQLHDTTKYDLDRESGKSEVDILRDTLLNHKNELAMLLQSESHLESFVLPGGSDGKVLDSIRDTLSKARTFLLGEYAKCGNNLTKLMEKLADKNDKGINQFLSELRTELSGSSKSVLNSLQRLFVQELTNAYGKSASEGKNKPLWQQTLSEIGVVGTLDISRGYGKFLIETIGEYFTTMDAVDRDRMAAMLMRHTSKGVTLGKTLGALLKGAGPILQKLLQGIPTGVLPQELREAVSDLKSNLAPIPEQAVRAYLYDMVANSGDQISRIEVKRSLGAASVGQAFLCKIYTKENPNGEECVVKILRPDVQNRAKREEAFFYKKAEAIEGMSIQLKERFERIFDELDLVVESRNVYQGAVYSPQSNEDGNADVGSMQLYPSFATTSNMMVLRKAPGQTLDRYVNDLPKRIEDITMNIQKGVRADGTTYYKASNLHQLTNMRMELADVHIELQKRRKELLAFSERWLYNAIFGDGFFHGDLHAGNIMTDPNGLTVIDYGNATKLTEDQRNLLTWMFAAIAGKQPAIFLKRFEDLLGHGIPKDKRGKIEQEFDEIFARAQLNNSAHVFAAAIQRIQANGVELPGTLFNFVQSLQRLEESVRNVNEKITLVTEIHNNMEVDFGDGSNLLWFEQPLKDELLKLQDGARTNLFYGDSSDVRQPLIFKFGGLYYDKYALQVKKDIEEEASGHKIVAPAGEKQDSLQLPVEQLPHRVLYNALVKGKTDVDEAQKAREYIKVAIRYLKGCRDPLGEIGSFLDALTDKINDPLFPTSMEDSALKDLANSITLKLGYTYAHVFRSLIDPHDGMLHDQGGGEFTDALANILERGLSKKGLGFFARHLIDSDNVQNGFKENMNQAREARIKEKIVHGRNQDLIKKRGGDLSDKELDIIANSERNFLYPPKFSDLLKGKWTEDPAKRKNLFEVIKFNFARLQADLKRNGYEERMKEAARFDLALTIMVNDLLTRNPDWIASFKKINQQQLDRLINSAEVANDQNLAKLLKLLHERAPENEITKQDLMAMKKPLPQANLAEDNEEEE